MAVVDRAKSKVVATWPVREASANFPMALDDASERLFVSGGAGGITTIQQDDAHHHRPLGETPNASGARTSLLVPEAAELHVAVPARGDQRAEVRTFAVAK